jgi:hypothetical protein
MPQQVEAGRADLAELLVQKPLDDRCLDQLTAPAAFSASILSAEAAAWRARSRASKSPLPASRPAAFARRCAMYPCRRFQRRPRWGALADRSVRPSLVPIAAGGRRPCGWSIRA